VAAVAEEIAETAACELIVDGFGCLGHTACPDTGLAHTLTAARRVQFRHLEVKPEFLFHPAQVAMSKGFQKSTAPFQQTESEGEPRLCLASISANI
jgi:hypothetical protein